MTHSGGIIIIMILTRVQNLKLLLLLTVTVGLSAAKVLPPVAAPADKHRDLIVLILMPIISVVHADAHALTESDEWPTGRL